MKLFYTNTYKTQCELLPRISIIYGKEVKTRDEEGMVIIRNGVAFEWLFFSLFIELF